MSPVTGVVFRPQLPPDMLRGVVEHAEEAGIAELWLWEDCFLEGGLTTAALALSWSTRLRVGVGLLPVPLRNPALAAMEIATVARMFPGRFHPGLGHGVLEWMEQVGARAESPMTLLREYTVALRRLLSGDTVSSTGRYVTLDNVGLVWPPSAPAPLLVGAVGPKTMTLAGELADGAILTGGTTPDQVRAARTLLDAAAQAAGNPRPRIVVFLVAATGPDAQARLESDLLESDNGDDLGLAGVAGSAERVAAGVRRLADAGADAVILQPTQDVQDVEGFVAFVAEDVAAVLGG